MNLFGWVFFTLVPIVSVGMLYLLLSAIYDKVEEILIERDFRDEK